MVVETVRKVLRALARYAPVVSTAVAPAVIQRDVERGGAGCVAVTKAGESSRRLPEAVAVLGALGQQCANTPAAPLGSDQLLRRVLAEQCEVNKNAHGPPSIQSKGAAEIPCASLQHPAAPDSSSHAHRGQGDVVHIRETYAEDDEAAGAPPTERSPPDLMTHVAVHQMPSHESQALAPALAAVGSRQGCPARLRGASHYGRRERVEPCHREGMALVAPAMPPKGAKQGQCTLEAVLLDAVGRVVSCPQGPVPVWSSVSEAKLAVRFELVRCPVGPSRHQCPGSVSAQPKQNGRWQDTHERVVPYHRRLAEQEPAFTAQ
jgi:hypothetical protein